MKKEIKINRTVPSILIFLFSIVILLFSIIPLSVKADDSSLSFTAPLIKPTTYFYNGEYGHIGVINKIWDETFDGRRRFHYLFLGQFNSPISIHDFIQSIAIYDGTKSIDVYDWDTADCSLEKVVLAKDNKNNQIYLFVAFRNPSGLSDILPQNRPSTQNIKKFQLIDNSNGKTSGKPRAYFEKVSEYKTKESVCTADEVYRLIRSHQTK